MPDSGQALTCRTPSARAARTAASLSSRRAWSSAASRCSAAASASARASARAWCTWPEGTKQSKARHGETSLRPAEVITAGSILPRAEHVQPARSSSVAYLLCRTRLGRCSNCCACTAGSAPAWRHPRARAPALRRSAVRPPPPPRRAPPCVRAAPRRTASVSRACAYESDKRLRSCMRISYDHSDIACFKDG